MGKEMAIKPYLTVVHDRTIHPKLVGADDTGVPASRRTVRYRAAR